MKNFNVFLSYTSREAEVKEIQPFVDQYCEGLHEWAHSHGLNIFYDHFSMERKQYSNIELQYILSKAVRKSQLMTAFISPQYINSKWCIYEWLESRKERPPILHAIHWKGDIDLKQIASFANHENRLMPEQYTDIRLYKNNNHLSHQHIQKLVGEWVKESIRLIEQHYSLYLKS